MRNILLVLLVLIVGCSTNDNFSIKSSEYINHEVTYGQPVTVRDGIVPVKYKKLVLSFFQAPNFELLNPAEFVLLNVKP